MLGHRDRFSVAVLTNRSLLDISRLLPLNIIFGGCGGLEIRDACVCLGDEPCDEAMYRTNSRGVNVSVGQRVQPCRVYPKRSIERDAIFVKPLWNLGASGRGHHEILRDNSTRCC